MDTIIKSLVANETAAGIRVPGLAAAPIFLPSAPPMVAGRGNRDPLGHMRNLWTDGERLQLLQLYRSDSGFHTHQERATELKRLTQSSCKRTPVGVRLEYKRLTANMALPQAIQQLQPSTVGQAAITATIATSANLMVLAVLVQMQTGRMRMTQVELVPLPSPRAGRVRLERARMELLLIDKHVGLFRTHGTESSGSSCRS